MAVTVRTFIWALGLLLTLTPLVFAVIAVPANWAALTDVRAYIPFRAEFYFISVSLGFAAVALGVETVLTGRRSIWHVPILLLALVMVLQIVFLAMAFVAETRRDLATFPLTAADAQVALSLFSAMIIQTYCLSALCWTAGAHR